MQQKIIFFDIDGTLVSFKTHKIPESALESLRLLRENGIKVFIATGRHKTQIAFLKDIFRFDGYITLNGQYCYNDEEVIHKLHIDKEDVRIILEQAEKHGAACQFVAEERIYINRLNDTVKRVSEAVNIELPRVTDIAKANNMEVYQLLGYAGISEEGIFLDNTKNVRLTRWHKDFADIVPKSGSKRTGMKAVLNYYGIKEEHSYAFGDGENDMEMLEYAGVGIAMGNASDAVKQGSDYVTASVDDDGVKKALIHFGLI